MDDLGSVDVALVVAVVAIPTLWGVVACAFDLRAVHRGEVRDGPYINRRAQKVHPWGPAIGIAAAVAMFVSPILGAFWGFLALNYLIGKKENVPFSRFPMFSRPGDKAAMVRFEDSAGNVVNVAQLGMELARVRKRFSKEVKTARAERASLAEARERAATVLAEWIEDVRPAEGRLATEPLSIVVLDYEFRGGQIASTRTVLKVTAPS